MKNTQRYIPEGYELSWDDQDLGIQVYYKESPTIGGLCFVGRAIKPTWHYRFKMQSNAKQKLLRLLNGYTLMQSAKQNAKLKPKKHLLIMV
jgi:hypothetical protein